MIIPAGSATIIALPRTKSVLSNIDLTITSPTFGTRYGGNSSVNEDGSPFKTVCDNTFDIKKVINILRRITPPKIITPITEENIPMISPMKNMDIIEMIVGNLPLQGIKLFVRMASSLSRGESMILAPVTPQALQPIPIHIVNACLPHA